MPGRAPFRRPAACARQFLDNLAPFDRGAEYIALFPNALFGIHRDHLFTGVILPEAVDRTRELFDLYYFDEAAAAPAMEPLRQANARLWRTVFEEDLGVVEGLQRGRASPAFTGGVFSPVLEGPSHCFHRWVADGLLAPDGPRCG